MKLLTIEERFWPKVAKGEPNECWEWQACTQAFGHGLLRIPGKVEKAHRVSYALHNGPIPEGKIVRHSCDNPPCVNPAHLLLGTRADNVRDRDERGRGRFTGHKGVGPKLNPPAVEQIRAWCTYDFTQAQIGKWFDVSDSLVCMILSGKRWVA